MTNVRYFFSLFIFISSMMLTSSCDKIVCSPKTKSNSNLPTEIKSWTAVSSPTTNTLLDVMFVNSKVGYIVGYFGTILKTIDGGSSWTMLNSGIITNLRSIYMLDANNGFAVGDNGAVLQTNDGGTTWVHKVVTGQPTLNKIYFLDNNNGFMAGRIGLLLKTSDGGNTWNTVNYNSSSTIYNIYFVNAQVGYVCGEDAFIAKTTDGGTTWTTQNSGVGSYTPSDLLLNIKFADVNNGFVIGENINGSSVYDTYILSTNDGGQHWTRGTYPYSNITLTGLGVVDASTAYVVGGEVTSNRYHILKTTDGKNWVDVGTGSLRLSGICLLDKSFGVSVGLNGIILKGN